MDCSPPGSSIHGDSPGKNTGVGCHALLQGIFLTQGLNLGLPHCRRILLFEPPGKPKIAGVGSLSLLQGNSLTGNQTGVYWVSAAAAKSLQLCPTVRPHRRQPTKAPLSLGFSRQEHWSGLPFPSRKHESEKWKWSRSVLSDSQQPHGLQPTKAPLSMGFSRQEYWSGVPLPSPTEYLLYAKYCSRCLEYIYI